MNVAELIEKLREYPEDMPVYIEGNQDFPELGGMETYIRTAEGKMWLSATHAGNCLVLSENEVDWLMY